MADLLALLEGVKPSGGRGNSAAWTARCPAHDDTSPSLSVTRGDDKWLVHCHRGCSVDDILDALHLKPRDLFDDDTTPTTKSRITDIYDYDGVFEVVRLSPKSFRQRRPDGKGGHVWNMKGVAPRVYHRNDLTGQPVVVAVEGEKDADRLWSLGIPATCNGGGGGAGKWKRTHTAQLVEAGATHVHVIPDADEPGRKHAEHVAASCAAAGLVVKVLALPDGVKDVSDWLDAGATKADVFDLIKKTDAYTPAPEGEAEAEDDTDAPVLTRLSDVQPEEVRWVWRRRFARGKLTIVAGEPGTGKSTAMLDLAARVTRGAKWPDDGQAPQGATLLLSAEDGLADTIRPKLDACDGDATLVDVLTAVRTTDGTERGFDLGRDMSALESAIRQRNPVLVIIDPLSAYLGRVDSWRDAEVRGVLAPLAGLAERYACAVVAVLHLTKNQGAKVLNRVMGSVGFVAAARIVLAVTHDPDAEGRHLLLPVKSNLAPPADTLAFSRDGDRVVWEDAPVEGVTVDGVMAESPADRGERADAEAFLVDVLAGGPVPAKDVLRSAKANAIAERTLKRAKSQLGVRSKRSGGLGTEAERWNRLKEQAIHGRIFQNLEAVRAAVADFVERYNQTWRLEKLGYHTPIGQWHWWLPTKTATSRIKEDVAPLETDTQEHPTTTGVDVKSAKYESVPLSGPVSDATKRANFSKRATNNATLNTAPLIERLNKTTKKTKSATSEVDGHPTSLLGGTRKPFVFDPKAAFGHTTDDDEADHDDLDEFP